MSKTHAAYERGKMLWDSYSLNQHVNIMFRNQILRLALARFKWVNLPETCNAAYLERTLLFNSWATIAFNPDNPNLILNGAISGNVKPNIYDEPTNWDLLGNNGFSMKCNNANGVVIYDNLLRCSVLPEIDIYSRELTDIFITARMNRQHQKMPYILVGSNDKKLDMTNVLKQVLGGEVAFLANDSFRQIEVTTLDTKVPFLGDELKITSENAWNSVYKLLGIPNTPHKKERMLAEEIENSNAPDDLMALNPLSCRRRAAKTLNNLINPKTGEFVIPRDKQIQVYWNKDLQSDFYEDIYRSDFDER